MSLRNGRRFIVREARPVVEGLEDRTVPTLTLPTDPFLFTPISFTTPLALHIHPVLHLFIDGQPQVIPADIGVGPDSAFPLHTHDATGTIHVESNVQRDFTVEDFFAIWNLYPEGQAIISRLASSPAVAVTDNGSTSVGFSPITMHDRDNIVIMALSAAPDATTAANEAFVGRMFEDLLHRPVDTASLVLFTTSLDQGLSRARAVQILQASAEYHAQEVQAVYDSFLHRTADPAGLVGFTAFLGNGGTVQQMEAVVFNSAEYLQLAGGTQAGFISSLYADALHRSISADEAAAWQTAFATGVADSAAVSGILQSQEAIGWVVAGAYQSFLHRTTDGGGNSAFISAIRQGMPQEQLITILVSSAEYFSLGGM